MNKTQHSRKLVPSSEDQVTLAAAFETRFQEIKALHRRVKDTDLEFPKSMINDAKEVRRMVARYRQDDFRHRESEKQALRALCQWSLNVKLELCNQPPQQIQWKD